MAIDAPARVVDARPEVACAEAAGCAYLKALSTIEHIAGFEHTARNYAVAASFCREQGCRAALKAGAGAPAAAPLIPFKGVHRPPPRIAAFAREAETVPFIRANLVDVVSDRCGNYVERRALKLNSLPARGDPLGSLYRYWCDLRAAGASQFSGIDTVQLTRAGIIGRLHIVNVSSSDPRDFRFELFGYNVPMGAYPTPCAYPVAVYADATMRDYNTVRLTASPRLHRVRSLLMGVSYHYTRLILPFLNQSNGVSHLVVAIRQEPGDGTQVKARD